MKYDYYDFSSNRSVENAEKIYYQRLEDAKYIYDKHHQNFIIRNCPYCGSSKYERIDTFHNMYGIDECKTCNSTFVNPVPNIEAISDYYENCICNRQLSKVIKQRYDDNDFINDDRVQLVLGCIEEILNNNRNGSSIKILEVGCNNGAFLSKLRQALEHKYNSVQFELCGVDIDSVAVQNSVDKKLNLFHGFAEEIFNEHQNEYDIVLHFELIEHLINPELFISSIYKMLKINGKMIFTTPNILGLDNQALDYNNMRYLAHALFPPMHLNAYSTMNVSHFLISNNFAVNKINTPGKFDVDMLSKCAKYLNDDIFRDVSELDKHTKALLQELIVRLSVSSHMQCVAIKH